MALSIANVSPHNPLEYFGRLKARVVTVTFDASYPTNGESLAPADLGFSDIYTVLPSPRPVAGTGYVVQWDGVNNKLLAFVEEAVAAGGPLLEVANTTDLSALVVECVVLGI